MAYAEFDFYLNTYLGDVVTDSDVFKRLSMRASEMLDHFTMHRIDQTDVRDEVRLAGCSMVEVLYYEELRVVLHARAWIEIEGTGGRAAYSGRKKRNQAKNMHHSGMVTMESRVERTTSFTPSSSFLW